MANIERVLMDSATQDSSAVVYKRGSKALMAGTVKLFWPVSADGKTGNGAPVVEYRVRLDNGHQVSVDALENFDDSGITITLGDFTERPPRAERFATILNTGDVAVLDISVILVARVNNTNVGILERLYAIEQELGSGGSTADPRFTVGVAVADPAATTSAALTNPADNADVAALVAWAKTVVTNFNAVRTTNSNVRQSVINLITSLENGGFITK